MINVVCDVAAPASLADQKSYRNAEVIAALYTIFRGKCYLTEQRFDYPEEMEIDHYFTQNENSDLTYNWENLYPIDQKANKSRPKKTPVGGYLDPCNPDDDVENEIIYVVEFAGNALFKPKDNTNLKAQNTADLLNHLHRDLKPAISIRHHQVVNTLWEWSLARHQKNIQAEYQNELLLRKLLSRDSQFTMLMRSIIGIPSNFLD